MTGHELLAELARKMRRQCVLARHVDARLHWRRGRTARVLAGGGVLRELAAVALALGYAVDLTLLPRGEWTQGARGRPCPTCRAVPGESCTAPPRAHNGWRAVAVRPHRLRVEAARVSRAREG